MRFPAPLVFTPLNWPLMKLLTTSLILLTLASCTPQAATAQRQGDPHVAALRPATSGSPEPRIARAYLSARAQGAETLYAFLARFPKGADLHVHLSGAVYAETFLREAGEDGMCVDPVALKFVQPSGSGACAPPLVAATELSGEITPEAQALYDRLVDAFSMRSFVPTPGWSGHDQFFATFSRFGGLSRTHTAEWVDEVAARAAAQNQFYLELMQTPPAPHVRQVAALVGWPSAGEPDFAAIRKAMLAAGLTQDLEANQRYPLDLEAERARQERCATAEAAPACQVSIRYIYQILRGNPPAVVFAQTLLGFETAEATVAAHQPGFVGINFVQPEDGYLSMRDYTLQMRMIGYLHTVYPDVHIALHAGELAPGLVPPEGLSFHIRQAVELAHAERIGHGVDLFHEADAQALLHEMASRHIMVEINLSSNEGILGVAGRQHPFPLYRAAHVPVALSTDDEGVSRIDLTHEYVRAALDYNLSYDDLKQLSRTGLAHSFLPGVDLWEHPDQFTRTVAACQSDRPGMEHPSAGCQKFLSESEKAAAEWTLERRFHVFERE